MTQRGITQDTGSKCKPLENVWLLSGQAGHPCAKSRKLLYLSLISFLLAADHGLGDVCSETPGSRQGKERAVPKPPLASESLSSPAHSFSLWSPQLGVNLALGCEAPFCRTCLVLLTCRLDRYGSLFEACSNCSPPWVL